MKHSAIKITAYISGGIIAAIILAIILLTIFVNPNNYKPAIIKAANAATGRVLTLKGDIKWKFLPEFGIQANQVSLSNPPEFAQNGQFAEIDSIQASISILPLLYGNVTIKDLTVNGLKLALITNGRDNNWTFNPTQSNKESNSKFKLGLNSFNLENSKPSYVNTHTNSKHTADNFSLQVKTGTFGKMNFNRQEEKLELKDVKFSLNNTIDGKLNLDVDLNSKIFAGNIDIPVFSLNNYLSRIKIARPKLANPKLLDLAAFSTDFNGTANTLILNKIHLQLGNSNLRGQINATSISPVITKENLTIDQLDLADYANLNGLKLPMKNIALNGGMNLDNRNLLNGAENLTIDNITLLGFNVNSLTSEMDKITSDKIVNISQSTTTFNTIQSRIKQLSAPGKKDLSKKTDLGQLKAQIVVRQGILTTPLMNLSGPVMITTGRGTIDLNKKTINYTTYSRFTHKNALLSTLVFPYHMQGKLSNFDGSLDWDSIRDQVLKYYAENIPGVSNTIKKAGQKTGQFFKNLF